MSKWDEICENCDYMDLKDYSSWGSTKYYCGYYRTYEYKEQEACGHFKSKYGWYVTTAFCNIVGSDNILETLTDFRDKHMINNSRYNEFLDEYGNIGPMVASKLENDPAKNEIAEYLSEAYFNPMISFIYEKRYDEAGDTYIGMFNMLKERYGFKVNNTGNKVKIKNRLH